MVDVKPFRGIMYNKEKIKKLDDVMSPPYDIISPEMQEELYKKHPYNVVRLILGKEYPNDDENNNRYTRAKRDFDEWLKKGILIQSNEPSIYPYRVEYDADGKKTFNVFFVLLKLDHEYRSVKAHERTLSKPKEDRLKLMRATRANLEPIELLYMDEDNHIGKKINEKLDEPEIDVVGYDGFRHMLWKLDDTELIEFIQDRLRDGILYIADGHHRYQTSINYAKEVRAKEQDPENYIMVVLANMFDEGLTILPTHRLIRTDIPIEKLIEGCEMYFDIEEVSIDKSIPLEEQSKQILDSIRTDRKHKFAICHKKGCYILTLKDEKIMDRFVPDKSKTWRNLDVSILHKIVIERILDIGEHDLESHVKYTRNPLEAIESIDAGIYDISVLLNPPKIKEIRDIASAGEHMPQKSTYFLPKLLSGLVMRKIR